MITTISYNVVILIKHSIIMPTIKKVESWANIKELGSLQPYQFFWFEKREKTVEKDNGQLDISIRIIEKSSIYYVNSYVETLEDILARKDKREVFLVNQMKNLGWSKIVKSVDEKQNWVYEFNDEDFIVDFEGKIHKWDT